MPVDSTDVRPTGPNPPTEARHTTDQVRYRRNPDLLLEWQDEAGPVLVDCRRWRKFTARPRLLSLLDLLDRPLTAEQAHTRWSGEGAGADNIAVTQRALEQLTAAGIIRSSAQQAPASQGLTPYERAAHTRAGQGPSPDAQQGTPPSARLHHPGSEGPIPLPTATGSPSRPFDEVLARRRCVRGFDTVPVPLTPLGAFLGRSAQVRGRLGASAWEQTQRPSPSAGGRHSLEIYLIAREISELAPGAYHYDPFGHALHRLAPWDDGLAAVLDRTVTEPAYLEQAPPAGLFLASRAARTGWKYEGLALSLIYRDTGCLVQTLCLTATDLGLAVCPTGAMRPTDEIAFLRPHQGDLLHVGSLALGLPAPDAATPEPYPLHGDRTAEEGQPSHAVGGGEDGGGRGL